MRERQKAEGRRQKAGGSGERGARSRIDLVPTRERGNEKVRALPPCSALYAPRWALRSLHADQSGTISIISVFALLLLTMLLGMVMNVGRQVDRKVRMQNAADSCAYSGGLVLARGMNSLAFTNHLLCDVFALTAYMREARDREAEILVPEILDAWRVAGGKLSQSQFPKFTRAGPAIIGKANLELAMVGSFSEWVSASSQLILPVLEEILAEELITKYQRTVLESMPQVAQLTVQEMARQHGLVDGGQGNLRAMLWRTTALPVGFTDETAWPTRTLPVVDPAGDLAFGPTDYLGTAINERYSLAHRYLDDWNNATLHVFDIEGRMSQFSYLWRSFTCGKLDELLKEQYPLNNLPFVIRTPRENIVNVPQHLEQDFTWLAVAYRPHLPQILPGLFRNPLVCDDLAFAQAMVFVPRPRLAYINSIVPGTGMRYGVPGDESAMGQGNPVVGGVSIGWENRPTHWDLLNQNWTVQLVPATAASLPRILSAPPGFPNIRVPNLSNFSAWDLQRISTH
jgi:hypothetical protein